MIDFHLVDELVQLAEIDSGLESARLRPYAEATRPWTRRCSRSEAALQRVIDHVLETATGAAGLVAKLLREVVVESQGGAHPGIMMPSFVIVKMLD
jgi:hypothetical protein